VARVLLVDDDIAEISAVKRVLARLGHTLVLATGNAAGGALADREDPPLALVAAACEGGGGAELARRLAGRSPAPALVVLGEVADLPLHVTCLPRPVDPLRLEEELVQRLGRPAPAGVRLPLEALSGGSHAAEEQVRSARAAESRRVASAALRERAEAIRREAAAPAGWLQAPELPGAEPAPEPPPPPPALAAGTLAEAPMPALLALAARSFLTGRLDFDGSHARSLWFEGGRVVGAASAAEAEGVAETALRLGLLTGDQHRLAAVEVADLPPRAAAVRLLERGWLAPEELSALARRHLEGIVFALFNEPSAPFRFEPERVPPACRTALDRDARALAVDGVRRRWLEPRLAAVLGGEATLLAPVPGATVAGLGLSPAEERAVALADGLRTLDEVVASSPLDPLATRQLLVALVLVGALGIRHRAGAASPAVPSNQAARLRDRVEQARGADYLTLLGLGRDPSPLEVREAAARVLAELDAPVQGSPAERPSPAALDDVRTAVTDAWAILADPELGPAYAAALESAPEDAPGTPSR
jgi:CheY-like chemotaxis protein